MIAPPRSCMETSAAEITILVLLHIRWQVRSDSTPFGVDNSRRLKSAHSVQRPVNRRWIMRILLRLLIPDLGKPNRLHDLHLSSIGGGPLAAVQPRPLRRDPRRFTIGNYPFGRRSSLKPKTSAPKFRRTKPLLGKPSCTGKALRAVPNNSEGLEPAAALAAGWNTVTCGSLTETSTRALLPLRYRSRTCARVAEELGVG